MWETAPADVGARTAGMPVAWLELAAWAAGAAPAPTEVGGLAEPDVLLAG
jgi:hypothetical protein